MTQNKGASLRDRAATPSEPSPAVSGTAGIPSAARDPLHEAMQDEFNRAAGTDNWRLHDTPKMSHEYFNKLLALFGEGNYRIMVESRGDFRIRDGKSEPAEPWVRASLLISPEAVQNAQQYTSAIEARRAETSGSVEDESAVAKPDAQGEPA